ncbi:sigma-70 family RNA polymerase sigma factor [Flavivirga aquimarina]|uniref:Sigma-70 family RNA polymerase sigma factor n=1 Tax=Flavivirga aquimarina TaxID=2027862 RepID=A0ABT8WB87_9FLAO|nr:sigma-70 family RNA polymerase sigma factor [Flavivirga aquimarina]MDO5970414.1 sigma-70 family RNA polymerase sigma factor [Flavivirga aquimarina]
MNQNKAQELTIKEFENIFNRLYDRLCIFAYGYVNDLDLSKDIVQEVFTKVWEDKILFENKDRIERFFYKAVKNKSIDFLRSKRAKDVKPYPLEGLETLLMESYFLSEVIMIETSDAYESEIELPNFIERAVKLLPNKYAETIRLSIKNYTNKEIAKEMNISIHTVKDYKKESYKKLRKTLSFLRVK